MKITCIVWQIVMQIGPFRSCKMHLNSCYGVIVYFMQFIFTHVFDVFDAFIKFRRIISHLHLAKESNVISIYDL